MKIVNLDKITTRRDRVVILDGKEHVMHTPTVKDYIEQMKRAEQIVALTQGEESIETASKMLALTVETLQKAFPTIPKERLEKLDMDQLNALRMLAENESDSDLQPESNEGEAKGETE